MTAAERLELIRAKCRHEPVTAPQRNRKPGLIVRGNGKPTAYGVGPSIAPPGRQAAWVTEPDKIHPEWKPEFRKEAHWLTRVAEGLKRGWH